MPEAPSASDAGTQEVEQSTPATGTESTGADTQVSDSPSDDTGAKPAGSVLDAVMRSLKTDQPGDEASPASDSSDKDAPGKDAAEAEPLPDEVTTDELNRYTSKTRRRVQQLLGRVKEKDGAIAELTPAATQYKRIETFVQQSGLGWDEVNAGFEIMRALKQDPFEARERLEPIMDALNKACGLELPPDLRQKVDQGYVDEDTARQLAQTQARARLAQTQTQQVVQRVEQSRQVQQAQALRTSVSGAVKTFEQTWRSSDPDFAVKYPRVMEKVEVALSRLRGQGQQIASPQQVVQIIENAKKAVEADLKPFIQKREPINPNPSGGLASNASSKPKSFLEAVSQGLRA